MEEQQDSLRPVCQQEILSEPRVSKNAADAREHLEMAGDGGGDQQEEKTRWFAVDGTIGKPLGMAAEDHDGFIDQSNQGVATMRQGDTIADARAA